MNPLDSKSPEPPEWDTDEADDLVDRCRDGDSLGME